MKRTHLLLRFALGLKSATPLKLRVFGLSMLASTTTSSYMKKRKAKSEKKQDRVKVKIQSRTLRGGLSFCRGMGARGVR